MKNDLIDRGLIKQSTCDIDKLFAKPFTFYLGIDPSSDSMHAGHLLPIITAKRLIDLGHKAIILIGGSTAMIGDPTGRSTGRNALSKEQVDFNVAKLTEQVKSIIDCEIVNNADWTCNLNFLDFMQSTGSHFRVNNMIKSDCFKSRLEQENGLSFLEFSYMLLQANDFHHLFVNHGCTVQIGGNDQTANMIAGIDLIHKKLHKEAFSFTVPLLTDSNGEKFGKSAGNAIWLDENKTSVFDFFQFWRNVPDNMVKSLLLMFTFKSIEEVDQLMGGDINAAKKELAFVVTSIVHSVKKAVVAKSKAKALFEGGNGESLEATEIESGTLLFDLLITLGVCKSKGEGRRLAQHNGLTIDEVIVKENIEFTKEKFPSSFILRKGSKTFFKLKVKLNEPQSVPQSYS